MNQVDEVQVVTPSADLKFRRRLGPSYVLREIWRSRGIIRTLVERDLRVRYKQAILGFAWAVVTPITMMIVFTLFIQRVAKIPTNGVPYPLFAYMGLLPWGFFSSSVSSGSSSLLGNMNLVRKVYCPREVFPLAGILVTAFDTLISFGVLIILFVVTGYAPRATSYWVPLLMIIQLALTVGCSLIAASVVVYFRDLRHALPLVLQLGMFASPVVYSISDIVPSSLRTVYAAVNPMAPIIEGYRRAVLYGQAPEWNLLAPAALLSMVLLVIGYLLFKRLETGFVDVV